MIEHIVLFRSFPQCSAETRGRIVEAARGLKSEIPEILSLTAGENWCERSDGYEFALVARFQDKDSLEIYQKHPHHQRFVQDWIKPNVEKVLAVDYFID